MNSIKALLPIVFAFAISPSLSASDSLYFAQIYATINQNIDDDKLEQNYEYIERLVKQKEFQELDCYYKGKIFHKIGVSYYYDLDQEEEALRYFKDSVLTVWSGCSAVPLVEKANTIYNIALSYQYLGNPDQAKSYLDEALSIFESDSDYAPLDMAKKYRGTGNFYLDNHNTFRAELYYKNALNIYNSLPGTEIRQFQILNDLLAMKIDAKKYEEAKVYYNEALDLYRQFPESISDLKLSLLHQNAGIAYWEMQEFDEAEQKSKLGLRLIDKAANPIFYSSNIELVAMINKDQGDFKEAIGLLNGVVNIRLENLSNVESYLYLSTAYENICEVYIEEGRLSLAEAFLKKAFETLMIEGSYDADGTPIVSQSQVLDDTYLMRLLALKAKIYKEVFQNTPDKTLLEKSLAVQFKIDTLINQNLLSLAFETSKLNFLESIFTYYSAAIKNAIALHTLTGDGQYLNTAYYFSSKTKAIVLQNELNDADAFQSVASAELLKQEQELVRQMYSIQEQMSKEETDNAPLLRQYIQAQRELETFISDVEQKEPAYYQKKYAFIKPPAIDAVQRLLPKDFAVIEYFFGSDRIHSFWITRNAFFQISIANDAGFEQSIREYVDQCHSPGELSNDLSYLLYQKLLQKGLEQIGGDISRLCIIPDGVLHTVPFEALNSSGAGAGDRKFLIEDYCVSFSYSIGLLFRKEDRIANNQYLGFGSEYSSELNKKLKEKKLLFGESNLSKLILSEKEINRASALFSGLPFIHQEASLDNFYKYSGDAKIIHLSLHGLVDFDDPIRSSIIFDDREEDFVLSAADLYSHKINADLVVLSACHSASGKIFNGEGVQGMSKAFMLSGAKSILSSLWSASEATSLTIMTTFFQNIRDGEPNDLALHKAKLEYLSTARPSQLHPFYWANFILIGELHTADETPWLTTGKTAAILTILALIGIYFFLRRKNRAQYHTS